MSTQLMFNATFSFFIVKQKFSPSSVNSIFMLTLGAIVLGLHAVKGVPVAESPSIYILGFCLTLLAAVLYGLMLPLLQLAYKAEEHTTYTHIIEMQTIISISATIFAFVGMMINHDFQAIVKEMSTFGLGDRKYIIIVVLGAVMWQFFFLGLTGIISCSSSLLAGVVEIAILPTNQILAVIVFHEKFDTDKGISLALSIWGVGSYLYGERLKMRRRRQRRRQYSSEIVT